jgi:hypothetical protein
VWDCPGVAAATKRLLINSLVLSIFSYGCVTLPLTQQWHQAVDHAYGGILRYALRAPRHHHITFDNGNTPHVSSQLVERRIVIVGHALRHGQVLMKLLGATVHFTARKLTVVKGVEKCIGIHHKEWDLHAQDRSSWNAMARKAALPMRRDCG